MGMNSMDFRRFAFKQPHPVFAVIHRRALAAVAAGFILAFPLTATAADEDSGDQLGEIIVSARRQSESVMKVPASITAFDSAALEKMDVQAFGDYASKVSNLSFQYGGSGGGGGAALGFGGSRAIAIRGVSGAGTTGFYIDDTPIPATIDPQVVDLNRIEVLKGPQGTLYGAGSMGGNIRLISNAPAFDREFKYSLEGGYTSHAGSPDGRLVAVGNLPLSDSVALRVMGFANHDGGFIKRAVASGPNGELAIHDNEGAVTSYGASATALVKIGESVTITPRIVYQQAVSHGWAAAYAPLPGFAVSTLTQVRDADVQESYNDKWYLPSVQVNYAGESWDVTLSSSYFHRRLYNLEDGTEGTAAILTGSPYNAPAAVFSSGVAWPQTQWNSNLYNELRGSWKGTEHFRSIVGAYYANQVQSWENGSLNFTLPDLVTTGTWDTSLVWDQHINTRILERALYGEAYLTAGNFELTLGGRKFWLSERFYNSTNGFVNYGPFSEISPITTSETGFSPKVSLSYSTPNGGIVYATASKGYRPGGPNNPVTVACDLGPLGLTADKIKKYESDSLWNYELGAKGRVGNFGITAAIFEMKWNQVQQSVPLPVCFIPITANAGAARIRGGEIEVNGRITRDVDLRLGVGYQDPRITELGLTGQPIGSRIYQVPFVTGSAVLNFTHALSDDKNGFATIDYSYTGNSISSTTTSLYGQPPSARAGYSVLNVRFGMRWENRELAFVAKNLTDNRANLGDVNPIAYPRADANGTVVPRVAVLRPLQFGLEFKVGL